MLFRSPALRFLNPVVLIATMWGCGGNPPSPAAPVATVPVPTPVAVQPAPVVPLPMAPPAEVMPLPTISLGGEAPAAQVDTATSADKGSNTTAGLSNSERRKQVVAAMQGLQVMLGDWRGITNKPVGEFKGIEQPNWVWDFRSEPGQPALVLKSEQGQHVIGGRLTYLIDRQIYQFTVKDKAGQNHTLEGIFTVPVEEFEGEDRRIHKKFKLQLTEVADARDALQLVFNQQDNNRYQLEVEKKRGSRFSRVDTVGTQREGSSFALNDSDYKDRTCVISAGLGTSQVSFNGKSYWVCCSGCKAAFDEDPARWIAEFEAKQKAKEANGG